mgnify:CR=1 FL=1|tara:strand:+ start:659 stop:961 length:303 start_codon:yes stop_codon:yes gene_type:complete
MTKITEFNPENPNGILIDLTEKETLDHNARVQAHEDGALNRALLRLRETRNNLLKETDWTANSDVTMSDDMKTYRQALRDLPDGKDTVDKCNNATWPTKP